MTASAAYVTLEELAAVIGDVAAARLVAVAGGERVYVPRRFRANSREVQAIGQEAADKLSRHIRTGHGGMYIELPRGADGSVVQLRRHVARLCDQEGLTAREIAREARITVRAVRYRRAKKRAKASDAQGSLF